MNDSNVSDVLQTAGKLLIGLLVLAGISNHRRRQRTYQYNYFAYQYGGGRHRDRRRRGGSGPSITVGSIMILLGFLMLVTMIGPQLLVNLGLGMAFCFAPLAVMALIVTAIVRSQQNQRTAQSVEPRVERAETKVETRSVEERLAEAFTPPQAQTTARPFWGSKEKAQHPPAYYKERAAAYRQRIQSVIKGRRKGPIADTIAAIMPRLERWQERVTQLADRVANFENDKIIQRDIHETPQNINRLQAQIQKEQDPDVRAQMERTLAGYVEQSGQLEALVRLMRRSRLQLDDTLAAMGTIYSQVQMLDAMDLDDTQATQIADEIEAEVNRLNDLLSAFGEANGGSTDFLTEEARRIRLQRGESAR